MKRARSLLALALFPLAAGCAREPSFRGAPVAIVCVDTLRADRLPVYGYRAVATPALDAVARDSIVFDNAISHVPLTLPSHASLFTGLLPFQHGVRDNLGYRLAKDHPTLATRLKALGYATGGAVSAIVLDRGTGIAGGFGFYDDRIEAREAEQAIGEVQRSGGETARLLEDWISGRGEDRRWLAFLHVYEPHAPYSPPEPFRSRHRDAYDGEVAAADAIVGRFFEFLRARELYDDALIVFLSDHGEGLGEHGEDEHGIFLYREQVRVPLFVKLPRSRFAGKRVAEPVQIADVLPTVLAALGEKVPEGLPGRSLLAFAEGRGSVRRIYSETVYPRYHFGWSDLASLTDDRHQYIHAPRAELYDWRADPGETKDLAPALPPAFRAMRAELAAMSRPMQPPGASDPETVRKLASLGYIGAAAPDADAKDLPDPKDRIGVVGQLKEASRLASQGRDARGIELLTRLARENPRMLDVWENLARLLRRAGRVPEAIEALERADRLAPATPQILLGLADLHLENRAFDRARALALAAGEAGASGFRELLAAIALASGDLDSARREAETVLAANPGSRTARLLLARVALARDDVPAALAAIDEAIALDTSAGRVPAANFRSLRGDVLARLGREDEAEREFRAEIARYPENLDGWARLALLYASRGDNARFHATLAEMTAKVPTARSYEAARRVCGIVGDSHCLRQFAARSPKPRARSPR